MLTWGFLHDFILGTIHTEGQVGLYPGGSFPSGKTQLSLAIIMQRVLITVSSASLTNPGCRDFRDLLPCTLFHTQIAKDAKITRFTVRKACSGERANSVAEQPLASALEESNVRI